MLDTDVQTRAMSESPLPSSPDPATEVPAFIPVPIARHRHDGWTAQRQHDFLAALATTGVVSAAARAVGMGVTSAYRLRRRPGAESFVAAWDHVETDARDRALGFIVDRVLNGTTRPRFYRGRCVGHAHVYETRLALAALRACDAAGRGGAGQGRAKCNE